MIILEVIGALICWLCVLGLTGAFGDPVTIGQHAWRRRHTRASQERE